MAREYLFVPPGLLPARPAEAGTRPLLPFFREEDDETPRLDVMMTSTVKRRTQDGMIVVHDETPAVVNLELGPEGVDWLVENLPAENVSTQEIAYARALARHALWDQLSGGEAQVRRP